MSISSSPASAQDCVISVVETDLRPLVIESSRSGRLKLVNFLAFSRRFLALTYHRTRVGSVVVGVQAAGGVVLVVLVADGAQDQVGQDVVLMVLVLILVLMLFVCTRTASSGLHFFHT